MTSRCAVRGARLPPSGFSLLEVSVVITILGLIVAMSGLAFVTLRAPRQSELVHELSRARAEAIKTGRPVVSGNNRAPRTAHVLFLPDARAIGFGADPLTGAPVDAPQ